MTFRLEPSEIGSKVLIETDLTLSGSVAQYGRGVGMIQSVASQLIGQFAKALEEEIAQDKAAEPAAEESPVAPTAPSKPPPAEPQAISGFSLFFAALGNWLKGLWEIGSASFPRKLESRTIVRAAGFPLSRE